MSNCPNYYISSGKERQLSCVTDIGDWMLCNKLKLNQDKMELLVVSSRFRPRPPLNHVQIGDDVIRPCEHARNVGVGFDQYFDFSEHVKMTTKIAFFRICGIAKIRRHLSHDTSKTIVHAYITIRLIDFNLCKIQQLALSPRWEIMIILHRFLGLYTGCLCAIELFLKYRYWSWLIRLQTVMHLATPKLWTSGYHHQLLYLKLRRRHICLRIHLIYNYYY